MDRQQRTKKAKFSLEGMKEAREGGVSRLDQFQLEEEEDVYELVDEQKYAEIVESRRKAGDFVVDDDGLGYYDDGEEHLGVGEDAFDKKQRLKEAAKEDDSRMTKKARRLAEESLPQKNTILKHLQSGVGMSKSVATKEKAPQNLLDIDALLDEKPTKKSSSLHAAPRPVANMKPLVSLKQIVPSFSLGQSVSRVDYSSSAPEVDDNAADEMDAEPDSYEPATVTYDSQPSPGPSNAELTLTDVAESNKAVEEEEDGNPKLSLSKTTKKLKVTAPPSKPSSSAHSDAKPLNSLSGVKTESIFGDGDAPQVAEGAANKIDPKQWLRKTTPAEGEEGEDYVNMYWLDAVESNGVLYLFGRIPVDLADGNKRFHSSCIAVHGCERNLFVLPKSIPDSFKEDGSIKRQDMAKVYAEINSLLVPAIVPRQQGVSFKCKTVSRKYAFEFGDVPRDATDYLKVVYSAKYPAPSAKQCAGGQTFDRIFGSTSSPLELFILKRKLMGPCWITIKKPRVNSDSISWCKLELSVDDPKLISKLVGSEAPAAPPLTTLSLSIKTAVNPSTHLHEIIALSGLIHTKIDAEGDSDVNPVHLKRFTFIRALGLTCGSGYPSNFPHDMASESAKYKEIALQTFVNERSLLSMFLAKLQQEDPDVLTSHNLLGFELDVIMSRAIANKLPNWSLLGRLRKSKPPKSVNEPNAIAGRILCDTYKAAKEFLRETTYSLTHLVSSQLKQTRQDVDPIDVPKYFSNSVDISQLAMHTYRDTWFVQGLMLKLQVIPLTKQLTNLSGNLWSKTIRGARAERIEYLLLHEFHALKYILPERKQSEFSAKKMNRALNEDGDDDAEAKVGGMSRKRAKAAYAGGLVLEPKKGLYDTYILLLDFNSLYPSIIQEYNLCFTTISWTKFMPDASGRIAGDDDPKKDKEKKQKKSEEGEESDVDSDDEGAVGESTGDKALPPLPDPSSQAGVLPRVIKTLVDRRRQVKNLLKNEKDASLRQQLDIRQKALKLTANSMYGCLGFSFSRFYARPIAALVTAMGREALQRTVDFATNQMALNVIYGDTDSVMINTGLNDLSQVKEIGFKVKREVNKMYKSLELDLDGIFRSMLLLKKKKYAALVVNEQADGSVVYEKEMKGLDLVRRDWCPLSKNTGKFVVDQILSGKPCEEIVMTIHDHLSDLSRKIRGGEVDLEEFIVTKGLNKNPKDYPDCNGQAHLQVALQMLKANKPVNIGDHIPYVICTQGAEGATAAHRAYHPEEIRRRETEFTIDYEWYLSNQILPPISRLCEPIEGTSPAILSERLGLDASKYARSTAHAEDGVDDGWGFTPKCLMNDTERFKDCVPLTCVCSVCHETVRVTGVMDLEIGSSALTCPCGAMYYGRKNASDCYCYLSNRITQLVRECVRKYYECWLVCDDHSCGRRTMQQSVRGLACTEDCHGRMVQEYDDAALHMQLKYLESLFDVPRMQAKKALDENTLHQLVSKGHQEVLRLLREHMANSVKGSAYNWVRPSLWSSVFGKLVAASQGGGVIGKAY